MTRLPSLGPHGEGWVLIQVGFLAAVVIASNEFGDAWDGTLATLGSIIGILLIVLGAALFLRGLLDLGKGLTPMPRPRDGATLVETGAFALVRHPLYGGLIIAAAGWALLHASPAGLLAAMALAIFFDLKSRREEAWLAAQYDGYAEYAGHTRRLIPWIY